MVLFLFWHLSDLPGFVLTCVCVCLCVGLPLPPNAAHQGYRLPTEDAVPCDIFDMFGRVYNNPTVPNECVPVSAC